MSAFNVDGGLISQEWGSLANNSATDVYTATGGVTVASIIVTPTSGTPNLTIEICNAAGTKVGTLRKAVAMTAGTAFIWNEAFILPALYSIRLTSSSATGDMDYLVTHGTPAAARLRGMGTSPA